MKSIDRLRRTALLLALAGGLAASGAHGGYSVNNLSLGGWAYLNDHQKGMNASGEVTGYAYTPNGGYRAFRYSGGAMQDLGTLGGDYSWGYRINSAGHVIGYSYTAGNYNTKGFVWTPSLGMVGPTLGGDWSWVSAINASTLVAGSAYLPGNSAQRAFVWSPSAGAVDIGTLGGQHSWANDVNDAGQVVGGAHTASGYQHAFRWSAAGGMTDLGTLGGGYSWADAINSSGQVVGGAHTPDGYHHAFSWTPSGGMVDLGVLSGGRYSWAYRVSDSGHVIGYSEFMHESGHLTCCHSFVWSQAGGLVRLSLGGSTYSWANSINAAGKVTGYAYLPSGQHHAFSWTPTGGLVDLGALGGGYSVGYGVNNPGQIVGGAYTTSSQWHGFIHDGTTMKDLNSLLTGAPAGTEIYEAQAISDNGSIVAYSNAGLVLLSGDGVGPRAPAVGPIALTSDPVAVGVSISATAGFSDANTGDTHTGTWTWGDATPAQAGTVSESNGSGSTSAAHSFASAGIYPVAVSVRDSTGLSTQVSRNIVVYDPSAGFVTGGGWIQSPLGAYRQDVTITGRATFAFVSKYQKGANVPTGTTEFRFQAANLRFFSNTYDWLVVGGARAQFKGTGSLNEKGGYKFLLSAVDGDLLGGGAKDRFRIKIWHYDAELEADVIDYDNQVDAGTEGGNSEGTAIGGGSIVVHTKK